eukprot:SAG31_NODE_11687_length_1006_cov_1.782800_1_plen_21_part_10
MIISSVRRTSRKAHRVVPAIR